MADSHPTSPIQRFTHLFQRLPLGPLSDRTSLSVLGSGDRSPVDLEKLGDDMTAVTSDDAADIREDDIERRRDVRTVPPWIHSLKQDENHEQLPEVSFLSPTVPNSSHPPHHPYVPTAKHETGRGKLMDSGRSKQPAMIHTPFALAAPKWESYKGAAQIKREPGFDSEKVTDEWMKENLPDLESPWNPDGMADEPAKDETLWLLSNDKRNATIENFRRALMKNAFVPLIVRVIVLVFVLCALGLGVTIYKASNNLNNSSSIRAGTSDPPGTALDYICAQQPSTYMSFIVDAVAVIYLSYITWDEYTSKPLGLRRSRDKVRLLFLDLIFIVFSAANTSLAFNTLTDRQWACYEISPGTSLNAAVAQSTCVYSANLCARQRALCAMLVLALTAWFVTFAISVSRVVDKLSR